GALWIVARQHLVDVVQEGRRLDEPPVDRHAVRPDPSREPRGHLADGPRVMEEPRRWFEGEQEGGRLDPPGDRHPGDGSGRATPRRTASSSTRARSTPPGEGPAGG